jgi:autotransporter-associated beta strand protein
MKTAAYILVLLGVFLFCLHHSVHADNLILNVPDWNQPGEYYLGNYPQWCSPTAGASIMGYWEDAMGRTGLADRLTYSKSTGFPNTAGTWKQGLYHDGSIEMGWFMDTDGWSATPNSNFPPGIGGTPRVNIAPGLLKYATTSWTDHGTGIVKTAYPDTTVIKQNSKISAQIFSDMWDYYKAEIDAGRPVEISFDCWVNPNVRMPDLYIANINQPIEHFYSESGGGSGSGHSVVGVGYIDPSPGSINGDEYFVCQDNWPKEFITNNTGTGRYVAMELGDFNSTHWEQCVYVHDGPPSYNWLGGLLNQNAWDTESHWSGEGIVPPNSAGAQVIFGSPGAVATIDLVDEDRTVGTMIFNSDVSSTIQSANGHSLVLDYASKSAVVNASGTHVINTNIKLNSNADFTITSTHPGDMLTINGVISDGDNGPKGITKNGNGVLKLSVANTYTGGTTINEGTLSLFGGNDRLATTGAIAVTGGILNLGGNTQNTSAAVQIRGGLIETGTIQKSGADYDGRAGQVSAVLGGAAGLSKTTAGALTLTGANTYGGGTTINAGTLLLDYANVPSVLKSFSALNMGGGKLSVKGDIANPVDQFLGNLAVTAGSPCIALDSNNGPGTVLYFQTINAVPIGATLSFTGDDATGISTISPPDSTGIYSGRITYNNDWATSAEYSPGLYLLKSTTSYTILNSTSDNSSLNYKLTGSLTRGQNGTINTLKLITDNNGQSLNLDSHTLTLAGGGLLFVGANDYSISGGTLKGAVGGDLVVHQRGNGILTIGAVIADNGGATGLTKSGTGVLALINNNTYTGGAVVNDGVLSLATTGTLPGGHPVTVNGDGTLRFDAQNALGAGTSSVINIYYGTVTTGASSYEQHLPFGVNLPAVNMTGGLLTANAANTGDPAFGNYMLNGNITTNAAYVTAIISAPGSKIGLSQANTAFNVARGEPDVDLQVDSILSDGTAGNALTKEGSGIMALGGKNAFTGGTIINGGILALVAGGPIGTLAGGRPITVNGGGTLRFDTQDAIGSATGMPSIINIIGGIVTTAGSSSFSVNLPAVEMTGGTLTAGAGNLGGVCGQYMLNGDVTTNAASTAAVISAPSIGLSQANTTFNVARGSSDVDLLVTSILADGAATNGIIKEGAGIMELKGKNTCTGGATVNNGTLILSAGGKAGSITGAQTITVNSAGTLKFAVDDALGSGANLPKLLTINGGTVTTDSSSFRVTLPAIRMTGGVLTADPGNKGNDYGQYLLGGKEFFLPQASVTTYATTTTATISASKISLYFDNTIFNVARGTAEVDLMVASALVNWSDYKSPGLQKMGSGIMVVSGNSTYSGPTTLSQGALGGAGSPNSSFTAMAGTHLAPAGYDAASPVGDMNAGDLTITDMTCDFHLQNLGAWDKIVLGSAAGTTGAFTANGNNVIAVNLTKTADLRAGTYSLITYKAFNVNGNITLTTPSDFDTLDGYIPSIAVNAASLDLTLSYDSNYWQPPAGSQLKYHDANNWVQNNVPNGTGAIATFPLHFAAPNVQLDADATVGTILFDWMSYHVFNFQGIPHTITMDANAPNAQIIAKTGDVIIDPNLSLIDNTNLKVDGDSLTINGIISGNASITKNGTGSLYLNGANTYSGATYLSGASATDAPATIVAFNSLADAGASALGLGTSLTVDGVQLQYTGAAAASTNRSIIINGPTTWKSDSNAALGGTITANGTAARFYKQGSGELKYNAAGGNHTIASSSYYLTYIIQQGSVVIDGTDAVYSVVNGELVVGDTTPNAVNLTVQSGTLNVGTYLSIGRGNGTTGLSSTLVMNGGAVNCQHVCMGYDAGVGGFRSPGMTLKNSAILTSSSFCYLGESPGANADIVLQDDSQFHLSDWLCLGLFGAGTMTVKNNAQLIQSGGACDFNIGDTGRGDLTIQDNAALSAGIMFVGRRLNSNGMITQTGGTVDFNKTYNALTNAVGGADPTFPGEPNPTNAWGAYNLSGSSSRLSFANAVHVGNYGFGAFNQTGGAVSSSGSWDIGRHAGSCGVHNISGGSLSLTNASAGLSVGDSGVGTLNISGAGLVDVAGDLYIAPNNAAGVGVINLNGGTLAMKGVSNSPGSNLGTAIINLNGGELQAKADAVRNADFLRYVNGIYVLSGGAVINTDGNDVTINQVLAAPTGKGLLNIAVANGGAGYMGTPVVNITTSGSGKGATAVADVAGGIVTGITITSPGVDYAPGDVITVQLLGGGASAPAAIGAVTLNNGNSTTGGLTKKGLGALTLNGLNSYTGVTTISGGTLKVATLANGGSPSGIGASTNNPANLVLDGGTLQYDGLRSNAIIDRGFTVAALGGIMRSTGTGTDKGFAWSGNIVTSGVGNRTLSVYNESYGGGGTGTHNGFSGSITDDGVNKLSFTKDGPGRFWFLNGPAKTYSGVTNILAGQLWLGDVTGGSSTANMLPYGPGKGDIYINSGATLNLYHHNTNINGLNDGPGGGGTVEKGDTSGNKTFTLGNADANGDFSGAITGSTSSYRLLSLTKVGAGAQVLRGVNYYTGATTINNGVLELASTGQIASSSGISTGLTAKFRVNGGTHTVTNISGTGTTELINDADLTAVSVVQGTLTIGPGAILTIAPIPGGPSACAGEVDAVPEPSAWVSLLMTALGLGIYCRRLYKTNWTFANFSPRPLGEG